MSSHPPTVEDRMAVEATNESESAAAPQDPAPGAMLTDEDLESPTKKRNRKDQGVLQNHLYAHVHVFHCPKHVQSESLCVRFGESLSNVL